jgi:23S rRNA (uracil1939-C5)-methyltransferase
LTAPLLDCPKQARCPGCPLGALAYEQGLASKGAELSRALAGYAALSPELLPTRAASTTSAYRLRAKLVSHGNALGLFERGSHRVLDVAGCRVLSAQLTAATAALRRLLPLPIYGADLRETSQGTLVTLLSDEPGRRPQLETAAQALIASGAVLGVALSWRRPGDVRLLAGAPETIAGPSEARHALTTDAPYGYAAHGGFVQAHAGQASYVYGAIAAAIGQQLHPRVLELFAGNGSLALSLAKAGASVTAVEAYAPAIVLAERAAREQGLKLHAVASDATRYALEVRRGDFDAVIVNPPRRGLDAALRTAIAGIAPRALAYVSCNPHTLARDASHLALLGLRLQRAQPLDMIPWSDAVEVLAWFEPCPPPPPRVLFEDEELLAVDKPAHESTKNLRERVQRRPGCQHAAALTTWGEGVSGACWFQKARRTGTPRVEHELLVLCRGNLRKQGTSHGAARHSLARVLTSDHDELSTLRDFAGIRHPILGDSTSGDAATNDFLLHRHGLDRPFVHVGLARLRTSSGAVLEASSELAPDLAQVQASLSSD